MKGVASRRFESQKLNKFPSVVMSGKELNFPINGPLLKTKAELFPIKLVI